MVDLDIRPSSIAGQWYESEPGALARSVDQYLDLATLPEFSGQVIGVIAPHAGHRYSGAVAGHAFAAIRGLLPDIVIIVSPVHPPKWPMPANYYKPVLSTAHQGYATPLGNVPVDIDLVHELVSVIKEESGIEMSLVSRDPEHSLEIELPFLQRALTSKWKLVPIMVHQVEPQLSKALGEVLGRVLRDKKFLLVASTDLSHFYDQRTAEALDGAMLNQIEAFSPEGAFETERTGKGFACGLGALTTVLWASRELGANQVKLLKHATSGDVIGDYSSVVGYGAAVILKATQS